MAAGSTSTTELSPLLPIQYKTWVLKVSIHCEGCKRKVKKILMSMEDVYRVEVDSEQNKVTVTGNVDSEVLIRRLLKSGKHAELSPEKITVKKDGGKDKQGRHKNENSEKKAAEAKSAADGETASDSPPQQMEKVGGKVLVPAKNGDGAKSEPDVSKLDIPVSGDTSGESADKAAGDGESRVEKGESGKKKKKKQKVQPSEPKKASEGRDAGDESLVGSGHPVHLPASLQPPIYAVSYHAAHPAGKYIVNYAPPQASVCAAHEWEPHHMFSDENAHFCAVM